jgi:hypothetical protein
MIFGEERKYFGVLYSNLEPNYRRGEGSGVKAFGSRRLEALVAISDPIELAAEVLSAFVSNNAVTTGELPGLFEGLHATLKRLVDGGRDRFRHHRDASASGVDP